MLPNHEEKLSNSQSHNANDYFIKRQSCHCIETSKLACSANQLTGIYMMETSVFNELNF